MVEGAGAEFNENEPAIRLDDVTFRYEGNVSPSLEHVTLSVNKGDSVGILGGTGCGKTTLISLMTRLYDATEGKVYVFGNDIKDYTDAQLYGLFGVAPQKAVLFSGTVRENMKWGKPDATDEEIEKALVVSQSKEFVDNLKGRLDFVVAQDGKNLSGGQRQRLTIARALVSQPEILILDDSSSALDFATDANLRKALNALRAERKLTTVTVSQRATSIKYCDLIVVLDDGKIVGQGTHEELINSCEVYREICLSQNKEEEVK